MANKEILVRYAQLKLEIAKLESEADMLKEQALDAVKGFRGDKIAVVELKEFPGYKFTVMKRKQWTYSPVVTDLESHLKEVKRDEEARGTAKSTEKEILVFNSPKES